jgi:predicted Zn-dependent protease
LNLVQETLGGVPEQLDLLERLLRASGDDPRLVARKADLYTEHGDHARAEALIQGLWQRHPGDPGVMRRLVAVQRAAGKVDDYTRLLEDWIEASPDDDPARLMLAEVYAEQQRDDDALALLGALAESYPSNPIILNNLAWLLRDRDPEQALQYAEQAYRLSPEDPALLDTLGALLLGRGDSGRALRLLDAAHVADPNDPTIAYHYARALAAERRRGDARVVLLGLVDRPFPQQEAARQLLAELSD